LSPTRFIGVTVPKTSGFRTASYQLKDPKETASSNLLRSTNESARTAGLIRANHVPVKLFSGVLAFIGQGLEQLRSLASLVRLRLLNHCDVFGADAV
jgi:hypothetical protein